MRELRLADESRYNAVIRVRMYQRAHYRSLEAARDACCWIFGLLAAALITRDLPISGAGPFALSRAVLAMAVLPVGLGLLAGLYRGRYLRGSLDEMLGVLRAAAGTTAALAVLGGAVLPRQRALLETIIAGTVFAVLAMVSVRYLVVASRLSVRSQGGPAEVTGTKIVVFGAGEAGAMLVRGLARQASARYRPVAFLDDDPAKRRLRICGVPVLGDRSQMARVAAETGATVLVIAIARASGSAIRDLVREADACGLAPKVIPSVTELLTGGARIDGVRDPKISDLLGRRPVETDVAAVAGHFVGKRILVTGAGGSIGSELCLQLNRFGPTELILLDRDESALHTTQLALHGRALLDTDRTMLADIRDPDRIRQVFEQFRPQIVFHAAALKHLPLLERYPAEAFKSNVLGTQTVLEAAAACGVESFVNISTDKAADPVCVLGYSKRIAERLTAHMAGEADGIYLSVRFGNVLGSRGSVLATFSAQIAAGGPLTVTHPDVSRYFMTVGEAVQLVLQAAVIGRAGEVLVLDMGEQVRIADIARRMAAGVPDRIEIVYTGLRPGEKLFENLLGAGEVDERPRHPLIRHVPVPALPPAAAVGLNPALPDGELRAELERCCGLPDHDDLAGLVEPGLGQLPAQRDRLDDRRTMLPGRPAATAAHRPITAGKFSETR